MKIAMGPLEYGGTTLVPYRKHGCLQCRLVVWLHDAEPQICGVCKTPVLTVEACEELIVQEYRKSQNG